MLHSGKAINMLLVLHSAKAMKSYGSYKPEKGGFIQKAKVSKIRTIVLMKYFFKKN
jgi:hypothetical protein